MVTDRFAFTSTGAFAVPPTKTFRLASAGRYFSTGSSSFRRPCSWSCITATDVMTFDIE